MATRHFATLLVLGHLLVAPAPAQTLDEPPSAPADLVATVYSATAGAIAWSRSSDDRGAVPGYEVTRDGIVLGTFDALGYVDEALRPGTTHRYGVTAIDGAGQRSTTSTVALRPRAPGDTDPGGEPLQPGELRATVWSSTAAGLAWRRAPFGTRYVVRRDGEVLRDGTAFPLGSFGPTYNDVDMTPGRDHVYEIVSVDAEGRRSTPATLTVNTTEARERGTGPPMPRGLWAEVWSTTALGLSWERSPGFGTRYVVRRDGRIVRDGTVSEPGAFGPTYNDLALVPGRYGYSVVAVDLQGRSSPEAHVSVSTLDGFGSSGERIDIVRPDTAVELIGETLAVFRGESWADTVAALPGYPRPAEPSAAGTVLDCAEGGTATIRLVDDARGVGREHAFDDCREAGAVFDGDIGNVLRGSRRSVSARAFTVTRAGELIEFDGRLVVDRDEGSLIVPERSSFGRFEVLSPSSVLQLELLFIEELRYRHAAGGTAEEPRAELSGRLEFFSSRDSGGVAVRATTPEPLRRSGVPASTAPEGAPFTEGSLRVEATEDGSFVTLEAGNGDGTSARITVDGGFGGTTSVEEPWSTWRESLRTD